MAITNNQTRVLIAHQSTIPHYRVQFYNTLERLRPQDWCFEVVFDSSELTASRFFKEPIELDLFQFPILDVKTLSVQLAGKTISYQTFWRRAAGYELVIVENAVNNLAYPLCQIHQLFGNKYAYWGHGWDHAIEQKSMLKKSTEKLKMILANRADGFFAYTSGVKDYLVKEGLSPQRIFVVNNTIDINEQRRLFDHWRAKRSLIRQQFNLKGKKVLLLVGRFTKNKRLDFLLEALSVLHEQDPEYHLLLVGDAGEAYNVGNLPAVTYLGSIVEPNQLAKVYVASDLFAFPGAVGLGPLQALCYDLPVVTIDSIIHGPELDYLNWNNSFVLAASTSPKDFAYSIGSLFDDQEKLRSFKKGIWLSIQHLTIEQMASNFIHGINTILAM